MTLVFNFRNQIVSKFTSDRVTLSFKFEHSLFFRLFLENKIAQILALLHFSKSRLNNLYFFQFFKQINTIEIMEDFNQFPFYDIFINYKKSIFD